MQSHIWFFRNGMTDINRTIINQISTWYYLPYLKRIFRQLVYLYSLHENSIFMYDIFKKVKRKWKNLPLPI
jgi:hypothetical protein